MKNHTEITEEPISRADHEVAPLRPAINFKVNIYGLTLYPLEEIVHHAALSGQRVETAQALRKMEYSRVGKLLFG